MLDGDTLYVKNDTDSSRLKLRILCVDAPEKSQTTWGQIAIDRMTYVKISVICLNNNIN